MAQRFSLRLRMRRRSLGMLGMSRVRERMQKSAAG